MICNKCKEDKNEDDFSFKSKAKNLKQKDCKKCIQEYRKQYYDDNRNEAIEYAKISGKKIKSRNQQYIWDYLLCNPCVDCSESDPVVLDFDHRDGVEKESDICNAVLFGWSLEHIQNEIEKCDVRCANCHRRRTSIQFGWYKSIIASVV